MDVTGGLAKAISDAPAEFQPILQSFANTLIAAMQQALGESLAALTAERTEAIQQADAAIQARIEQVFAALDARLGPGITLWRVPRPAPLQTGSAAPPGGTA